MTDLLELPERDPADAKAWFYLDRMRDIEAWSALRRDAADLLDRYLLELGPSVEQLASALGAAVEVGDAAEGELPRFGLYKSRLDQERAS